MLHVPLNKAPGSIESLPDLMSPFTLEVTLSESSSLTFIFPFTLPETSALLQTISPFTTPLLPITTFPLEIILPSIFPSILMSPFVSILPTILVHGPIMFGSLLSISRFFIVFRIKDL